MNKKMQDTVPVFLSLLRVGLWEDAVKVNGFSQNDFNSAELKAIPKGQADGLKVKDLPTTIDYDEILHLAQVQSVAGLVIAGLEGLTAYSLPLTEKLKFLGHCQLIEQRNAAMNRFIEGLMSQLPQAGIAALLVKGQGLAPCYVRPNLRGAGDVDLLLWEDYKKVVSLLANIASKVEKETPFNLHQAMTIDLWSVELHGTLRGLLKRWSDNVVDEIQNDTFTNNHVL